MDTSGNIAGLLAEFLNLHGECEALRDKALAHAGLAIRRAIECGRLLIKLKKEVGRGFWIDWIAVKLSHISERTIYNYMAAAEKFRDLSEIDLENLTTATKLYQRVGLLPEGGGPGEPVNRLSETDWAKFTLKIENLLPRSSADQKAGLVVWSCMTVEKLLPDCTPDQKEKVVEWCEETLRRLRK